MSTATLQQAEATAALVQLAYPHLFAHWASGGRFKLYRHVHYVGKKVAQAVNRKNGRLMVNMPPRHGKSEEISTWTPPWFLSLWPEKNVMLCSYDATIAADFGRKVRNEVQSNPAIPLVLREDSKAANRWHTDRGGCMVTAGVGGAITGRGFHLGIIDDYVKNWRDANSATLRRHQIDWFESTFYTRCEPEASMIVLCTRWHPQDLGGWLIEKHTDDWEVVSLPAIAEEGDALGRKPGEALCPERYPIAELERIRAGIGAAKWNALYQQRPSGNATGRLYDKFTDANLDKSLTIDLKQPVHVLIDFNINPGMHVLVGQHVPGSDTFRLVHEIHGPRMPLNLAMKAVTDLWAGWREKPVAWLFGDASGGAANVNDGRSNWDLVKKALGSAGIRFVDRIPRVNPAIVDSVNAVNEALCDSVTGRRRLLIHPRCERTVTDFREVLADEDGKPDKTNLELTHASDCVRYWVQSLSPIGRLTLPTGGRVG